MKLTDAVGYGAGRLLHLGVRGEFSAFRRGVAATGLCVLLGSAGAAALAVRHWDVVQPLLPQPDARPGSHRLAGHLDWWHQCYVRGSANGVPFVFLIDSGASDLNFSRAHAQKLGINLEKLKFDQRMMTANGTGHAAVTRIRELRLGEFVLKDVPALVDDAGADEPLLGQTVLRLMNVELKREACGLTW